MRFFSGFALIHYENNNFTPNQKIYMLKIGILGVGHLGKFHLNNWKEISNVEVVGF
jgi:hypothetical protein